MSLVREFHHLPHTSTISTITFDIIFLLQLSRLLKGTLFMFYCEKQGRHWDGFIYSAASALLVPTTNSFIERCESGQLCYIYHYNKAHIASSSSSYFNRRRTSSPRIKFTAKNVRRITTNSWPSRLLLLLFANLTSLIIIIIAQRRLL